MKQLIEAQFERMGARARVTVEPMRPVTRAWNGRVIDPAQGQAVRVNVLRDEKGEYFQIMQRTDVCVQVLDVRTADQHLLLTAREGQETKSKFLCGHDERAWFVAAIPESAVVRNVQHAKDSLKPKAVWDSIRAHNLSASERDRRWTTAFVRQGEWFFIPRPNLDLGTEVILRNEPIQRGRSKPHMCQFMCRFGGERVYVSFRHPNGLTLAGYKQMDPMERTNQTWRTMMRDARVYAKGAIRHPDHDTIWLADWHEVVMNTETQANAMRHVAFLD